MNKLIRTFPFIVAVTALMLVSAVALASPPANDREHAASLVQTLELAANPGATYTAMSVTDQEAVRNYLTVTDVVLEPESGAHLSSNTCDTNRYTINGRNIWGQTMWRFAGRTFWCYDGTIITNDPHPAADGYTYHSFWHYRGLMYQTESGGQGSTVHNDSAQGEFEYCIPHLGCYNQYYPSVLPIDS